MRPVFFKMLFLFLFVILSSCNTSNKYVFSSDRSDRPITGCLQMGSDGFFAAAIAMNCQKSLIENIMLCSNGRTLSYYKDKNECEKANLELKKTFGIYSLKSDPDA
jgi:hypothetical protein